MSVTYSECVFVGLGFQHATRMRRVILPLCPVWLYRIFKYYLKKGTIFGTKIC
jgi:hypothetical protein